MFLKGLITALVTPFQNGKIDLLSFEKLIAAQINGGVDGIVVCGTTGESPVLTTDEFKMLIESAVKSAGDMKVFVGVGSCDTTKAVEKTKIANSFDVYGMLAVTPYYNKPTQDGLLEYYNRIASETDKEIMLYSVPSRTGVEIAIPTVEKLKTKHQNINSLKEATENCARVEEMAKLFGREFSIFSGNDSMTLPFISLGAVGVVSVMSNVLPREMSTFMTLAYSGDFHGALKTYQAMNPVMKKLFIETNPLPVKYLLKQKDIINSDECRSPLGKLSEKSENELLAALRAL